MLALARFAFLLRMFVLELAVVQHATDRWNRRRRNFYEVEVCFAGHLEGLCQGQDAKFLAGPVDD
jgi:hypothetical protein